MPEPFYRHQFVQLRSLAEVKTDKDVLLELSAWVSKKFPFIVRRPVRTAEGLHLGLSLPPNPEKRRLCFCIAEQEVEKTFSPPLWTECAHLAGRGRVASLAPIECAAKEAGEQLCVFGSLAWEYWTSLSYLTKASDVDLLLFVSSVSSWHRFTEAMSHAGAFPTGIDLEIVLPNGTAFQWREFIQPQEKILCKGASQVWLAQKTEIETWAQRSEK